MAICWKCRRSVSPSQNGDWIFYGCACGNQWRRRSNSAGSVIGTVVLVLILGGAGLGAALWGIGEGLRKVGDAFAWLGLQFALHPVMSFAVVSLILLGFMLIFLVLLWKLWDDK